MEWFVISIFLSVILGGLTSKFGAVGGPLHPETNINIAVGFICFVSGLKIDYKQLIKPGANIKVCGFALLLSFVVFPTFMCFMKECLFVLGLNDSLLKGLVVASVMPPPITSAIIMTRESGGNVGAAILISIVGNILGIVCTPLAVYLLIGSTSVISLPNQIASLIIHVLLPLLLGQSIQCCKWLIHSMQKLPLSFFSQLALLYIIYTSFCESFNSHDGPLNSSDIIFTFIMVVPLQLLMMDITFRLATYLGWFSLEDTVALIFCSSNKSFSIGLPILKILFEGYSDFALISLPLLVYYPTQVLISGFIVPIVQEWMFRNKKFNCEDVTCPRSEFYLYQQSLGIQNLMGYQNEARHRCKIVKRRDRQSLV